MADRSDETSIASRSDWPDSTAALAPEPITPEERRIWLEEEIRLSRQELARPAFARDKALVDRVAGRLIDFLRARPEALIERHRAGKIVEGHGDLRPEHICLAREPVIIDCLEFSRALRLVDPADELAFLALECAMLGEPEAGVRLQRSYETVAGDRPPEQLLAWYTGYRAFLRARLSASAQPRARERGRRRLGLPKLIGILLWRSTTPRR